VPERQRGKLVVMAVKQQAASNNEYTGVSFDKCLEDSLEVAVAISLQDDYLPPKDACGCKEFAR